MTGTVFVDANVFLYAHDEGDPVKQPRAYAWVDHLWQGGLGRTSMQVLSEYYVNLKRKAGAGLSPEDAWERVSRFLLWKPQPVDEPVFRRAREIEQRWRLSWWDSMVVAAAQVQGCALLLTEDLQDGAAYGGVTVRSPFTLDVREPVPAYAVAPAVTPHHRGRGRPRKSPSDPGLTRPTR
jgi:predicted nucleic acid-binding protein